MRKFWVIFSYDHGRQSVNKAMTGKTGRHVAVEMRKFRRFMQSGREFLFRPDNFSSGLGVL